MNNLRHDMLDVLARIWLWLGNGMRRRPLQILGVGVGLIIATSLLAYSLSRTADNTRDIDEIQKAFCSSRAEFSTVKENCRLLLDRLLKAATPEQVESLRRVLEGVSYDDPVP